jgi:hypothetical protein
MTMILYLRIGLIVCALVATGAATASRGEAGQEAAPVEAPAGEALQPYAYESQGRRDPFLSLVARGKDTRAVSSRPAGLSGLLIGEVTVRGVVVDRSGFIAMVQGPDRKTFIVRPGEKLMDGSIKAITAEGLVFLQDVNDPLATVKQKEVRKSVRPVDGGRQ